MKNPFSTKHDTFVSGAALHFEQLADKLDLYTNNYWSDQCRASQAQVIYWSLKRAEPSDGYLGRNHAIFENVRFIGYRNSHLTFNELYKLLLRECEQYNTEYYSNDTLAQYNHLTHIVRSITKVLQVRKVWSIQRGNLTPNSVSYKHLEPTVPMLSHSLQ